MAERPMQKKNKSIILLAAHYASWEWLLSINESTSFKCYGVYKKVNNKYFDAKVRAIRSKFKSVLVTTDNTIALINDNEIETGQSSFDDLAAFNDVSLEIYLSTNCCILLV